MTQGTNSKIEIETDSGWQSIDAEIETATIEALQQSRTPSHWFCDLVYQFKDGKPVFVGETDIDFAEFDRRANKRKTK